MTGKDSNKNVLVVGGGVAGMQAAIQCARLGFSVYLVDRAPSIGGHMSQLDKTFPTNDCAMCILSPRLHDVKSDKNITLLTYSKVEAIEGSSGDFSVAIRKLPRYVDEEKCIGCGTCTEKCPVRIPNPFNLGLSETKAIHQLYPQAVPSVPVIEKKWCRYFLKGKCRICEKLCPTGAIDFGQKDEIVVLKVGAIINSSGFTTFDPGKIPEYNYSSSPDILTSLEFERILSPTGPTGGELVRLSDGSVPRRLAFIQCVGSRDTARNRPYCSEVCCLVTFKQAMLALERGNVEEIVVFYIDRRAQEKDGEEYLNRLENSGRVKFVKGKVARIEPGENGSFLLNYSDLEDGFHQYYADMVVLAVGIEATRDRVLDFGSKEKSWGFTRSVAYTDVRDGIFNCGCVTGPKSIPGAVLDSEAAASETCKFLGLPSREIETISEELKSPSELRLGIFICKCGTNIAGVIDTKQVVEFAKKLPNVVWAQENLFSCSSDATKEMTRIVKEKGITRLLVASCTPRTHLPIFQDVMKAAGLNPGLVTMANIREQCAWVHKKDPLVATEKGKKLVEAAAGKVLGSKPLSFLSSSVIKRVLILGGGVAGLTAATTIAEHGIKVTIVEKTGKLGGRGLDSLEGPEGANLKAHIEKLILKVNANSKIDVFLNAELVNFSGAGGKFLSTIRVAGGKDIGDHEVSHGALVVAIGAQLLKPRGLFGYGEVEGICTQRELESEIAAELEKRKWESDFAWNYIKPAGTYFDSSLSRIRHLCMIQCVGSRNEERPYCSRVCCTRAVTHALVLKELYPHMNITVLYRDIRTYGFNELIYQEARENGVVFVRYDTAFEPVVSKVRLGMKKAVGIRVKRKGSNFPVPVEGQDLCLTVDRLVLSEATIPTSDHVTLSKILKLPLSASGFFMEKHPKLAPAETQVEGIYVCGQAHYPKTIRESITHAKAVSAKVLSLLSQDVRTRFAPTVSVIEGRCVRCLTCVRVCPYEVPVYRDGEIYIDKLKCQGCGICVSECPNKAIEPDAVADLQMMKELQLIVG